MSERDEQIKVFNVLRLNEQRDPRLKWVHASMNGLYSKSARMAMDRKRQGQTAGIADICIPFGSTVKGDLFAGAYIEMKVKPNKCTDEQAAFLSFVAGQGYATCVAYSAAEALDFIESYTGTKLRGR